MMRATLIMDGVRKPQNTLYPSLKKPTVISQRRKAFEAEKREVKDGSMTQNGCLSQR